MTATTAAQLKEALKQEIIAFVVANCGHSAKTKATIAEMFEAVKAAAFHDYAKEEFISRFSTPQLKDTAKRFVLSYENVFNLELAEEEQQQKQKEEEGYDYRYDWEWEMDHPVKTVKKPVKKTARTYSPRRQTVGLHPSDYCGGLGA